MFFNLFMFLIKHCFISVAYNFYLCISCTFNKFTNVLSQQGVIYMRCDLCDAGYVGYTCRHLHQRIWRTQKTRRSASMSQDTELIEMTFPNILEFKKMSKQTGLPYLRKVFILERWNHPWRNSAILFALNFLLRFYLIDYSFQFYSS